MYEENVKPLPPGDALAMFATELQELAKLAEPPEQLSSTNVVQLANTSLQEPFAAICRQLLLPGSAIQGWENVEELGRLARDGQACLLCLSHTSNLDVPNLYTILADQHDTSVFDQTIWIAGRKLSEDSPLTQVLIQSCNRIVVTPPSWFEADRTEQEAEEAHRLNRIAQREMLKLRNEGRIFGLFPTATRLRPGIESTAHAIPELDTYVKTFDQMVIGRIDGCTLPVSRDRDYMHEVPRRDRVIYTFGAVHRCEQWREKAQIRFPALGQRDATARAMDEFMEKKLES